MLPKNPHYGAWPIDWNDRISVDKSTGTIRSSPGKHYITEDPTAEAALAGAEEKILDSIRLDYSLQRKDPTPAKKHRWKIVLYYKRKKITFNICSAKQPSLVPVLLEIIASTSQVRYLEYSKWCASNEIVPSFTAEKTYQNIKKRAQLIDDFFGEDLPLVIRELSETK
ncbi:MAG: hypothetical protein AVO34_05225 [Firmicutes bacterium ML8_F2]|nr:MAG: hypothetical protein AVO34_05225 [Firmicutes bacterium ML8_F2]